MKLTLNRFLQTEKGTVGVIPELKIFTLEEPWKDNKPNISCIPVGTYKVIIDISSRFKKPMMHVLDVPNRAGIRIHKGNSTADIEGCILVGMGIEFGAETLYVWKSETAHQKLFKLVEDAKQIQLVVK